MTPRVLVTVTSPEGRTKRISCYRAYVGSNRVTWIMMSGVRQYVLLRHGFTVEVTNL